MGTRALLEEGCRDIELWQTHEEGNPPATPESDLSRAFRRSGAGSGIVREARVESGDTLQERGFALAQEVFGPEAFSSSAPRPDGIVLSNDLMAHGALTALRKLACVRGATSRSPRTPTRDRRSCWGMTTSCSSKMTLPNWRLPCSTCLKA
jgi:DNA-binding LacI/PurR family transcriptional regulator